MHRLRATRWDRVEIICLPTAVLTAFVPLDGVECTVTVPLGGVEWRDTETTVTLGISVELQHHSLSSSGATGMFRVPLCVALWRRVSPVVSLREKNRQVPLRAGLARRAALLCDIGLLSDRLRTSRRHFTLEATCQAQRSSLPPARVRA